MYFNQQIVFLLVTIFFSYVYYLIFLLIQILGDVEERDGGYQAAIMAYKEALSIRTQYIDKFHPDLLGKLLHKIGVLNALHSNLCNASIYFAKAMRLYEFNNIEDSHLMVVLRDQADVLGKIALNTSIV
jgi:tetratricopeptide (TPR) repeat protein